MIFSATGLPPGLTIDPATGEIYGTIKPSASGTYNVTVNVTDGEATSSISFTLTVMPPPLSGSFFGYFPYLRR